MALTLLNGMADPDFPTALRVHQAWGLPVLDLKDGIFGKYILDLTDDEAARAADLAAAHGLTVYCLSTTLFHAAVEEGEAAFRAAALAPVDRAIAVGRALQPRLIRLLAPQLRARAAVADGVSHVQAHHPWLLPLYREAIDRLQAAGFHVTIENECGQCLLGCADEALAFFAALDRHNVGFTWDIQNMWEVGAVPTLDAYTALRPLLDYVHLKGGQSDGGTRLRWASALEDASWPGLAITRRVVADGVSPVVCLNPSHGARKPGYDYADVTTRDLAFLRREIPEIDR